MLNKKAGFTLIEILITIVVLSVIAGLAVPNYFSTVEQARSNEARVNLQIIRMGQKVYALNNGAYWNPGANPTVNAVNAALNTDITGTPSTTSTIQYFNIISINTTQAQVRRNTVQGGNNTTTYTINYATGAIT